MKTILVVDNNPMVLSFMSEILTGAGYEVRTSDTGLGAFDILQSSTPDFIFVDLVMPEIDGEQLLQVLKKMDCMAGVKKIILSAVAAENSEMSFGDIADACIAKMPFKKMKKVVLSVVADFESGNTEKYRDIIVGAEELYSREITEELLITKHHQGILLASIIDGFVEMTLHRRILYANPAAVELIDKPEEKILSADFISLFTPEYEEKLTETLHSLRQNPIEIGEHEKIVLNGKRILIKFIPAIYGTQHSIIANLQDITLRKQAEDTIKSSLEQKENLLREFHHRVKTNLQIISSLLNLQSQRVADKEFKQHFTRSQSRIEAMSLVHEQLHESSDLAGISLDKYLSDLVSQIIHTYAGYNKPIRSHVAVPDISVSIETAVPFGLIVNELITNALIHGIKYLPAHKKEGTIELIISMDDGRHILTVKDNGPGLPADFQPGGSESLGLSLVTSLADQLHGRVSFPPFDDGAAVEIDFQLY